MNTRNLAALVLMGATVIGCGDDSTKDGFDIDSRSTQQAITSNSQDMAELVINNLGSIEDSKLLGQGMDMFGQDDCLVLIEEGSGADFDSGECESEPASLDTQELDELSQEGVDFLASRIFAEGNVESSTSKSITYLLRGNVVCAEEGGADPDCVQSVDDLELRIYATSPQDGDIDLALQFGPQKHTPVYLEIHRDRLAAEIDLGETKGAVEHVARVTGEDIELPDTMRGRVRGEILAEGANRVTAQVSVVQSIEVSNDEISVALGTAIPAARVSLDGSARTVTALLDLGSVALRFPDTQYIYDSATGLETEESHTYDVFVAGASASTTLDVNTDILTVTEIALGDTTSTLKVDGDQVLAIDLNADHGRTLSATLEQLGDDGVEIAVSPAFDLKAVMSFASAQFVDDVEPWMADDTLQITLDGADSPLIQITDDGIKVVEGQLAISLENAMETLTVETGQCFSGEYTDSGGPDDVTVEENPVEVLEIISCN